MHCGDFWLGRAGSRLGFVLFIALGLLLLPAVSGFAAEMGLFGQNGIVDAAGRKIRVEKPFSRIISLYGAHTENLLSMGAADALIGVSRSSDRLKAAEDLPGFSVHDGPERFLAARPDLLLVRPMHDRGYADLMDRLQDFGVRVVSLQPGNVSEMKTYWKILARLVEKEPAAREMIRRFEDGVAEAREIAGGIESKKHVYFEAIHDRFKTFTPGSMPLFALTCAGGINVAADATAVRATNIAAYGKEKILSHAGEIDVYLAQKGVMNRVTVEEIVNEPGFDVITAVRKGEVHLVDETKVSRPTLRLLDGICRIGAILYPEHFNAAARQEIGSGLTEYGTESKGR
ncbi:MAG: ABC transporter substrate-binding protein [Desulfobacterales bacterium]|nr:ABC transporter substrate-binding protein [Desulfobacterales bacterium]